MPQGGTAAEAAVTLRLVRPARREAKRWAAPDAEISAPNVRNVRGDYTFPSEGSLLVRARAVVKPRSLARPCRMIHMYFMYIHEEIDNAARALGK